MEPRTVQFLAEAFGGEIRRLDRFTVVSQIATDSRSVQKGDLFFALPGEQFDGHDFLEKAFALGAAGAVVRQDRAGSYPCVAVPDTRMALGQLGARYRRDFDIHTVAVVGSNGKTTTKELLASVLRQAFETVASQASFNNDIGVPLTLLRLEGRHRAGVFEAGTNHPGELRPLLEMIRPGIGIVTSIGREHLEFFGDLEGVLQEEGVVAEILPKNGLLAIHGDGYGVESLTRRGDARVVRVGLRPENEWHILSTHFDEDGTHFSLQAPCPAYSGDYCLRLLGAHQALNATFAIVAAAELGLTRAQIQSGFDSCAGAKMRMQLRKIATFFLLDDAYNANADSMTAALDTLGNFPCSGQRIAVLGDMAELGEASGRAHEEAGCLAASRRIDLLVTVGRNAGLMAEAARHAGIREVVISPGVEHAGLTVKERVGPGDVVLVKASRSSRLERVVEFLTASFGAK